MLAAVSEAGTARGGARRRVHVASLPTVDVEENAAIVNALQHHAAVVVQKSLAEGFGLTVAEAMWKQRPVVASRIGGIRDQIVDGSQIRTTYRRSGRRSSSCWPIATRRRESGGRRGSGCATGSSAPDSSAPTWS